MNTGLGRFALLMLGGAVALSPCPPARAQKAPAPAAEASTPAPGPYEAKLDRLLVARDWDGLGRAALAGAKDEDTALRALNWLQARSHDGGGSYIALLYSAALWQVGNSVPEPTRSELHGSASLQLILARALIRTAGFQCADVTAPGARRVTIDNELGDVSQYLSTLPAALRKRMLEGVFVVLVRGFSDLQNDVWMCSGGMQQYLKFYEKYPNEMPKEEPLPGGVGKNVILPADPTILPDFVPYKDWQAKRRAVLDEIADELGRKRLTNYEDASHRMR